MGELRYLQQQIKDLTEQVALLSTANCPKDVPRCYNSQQPGHFQCQCLVLFPQRRNMKCRCYNCGREAADHHSREMTWERLQMPPIIGHSDTVIVATVHTCTSVINAQIGGVYLGAMLDSGSTISLLQQDMVPQSSVQCPSPFHQNGWSQHWVNF